MIAHNRLGIRFSDHLRIRLMLAECDVLLAEASAALWTGQMNLLEVDAEDESRSGPTTVATKLGTAQQWKAGGVFRVSEDVKIRQTVTVDQYPQWPDACITQWQFENAGAYPILFDRLDCPNLQLTDWASGSWSFQGAAVKWGQDFAFPLPEHFDRENFLGHLENAEGGGIPLVYFWNAQHGLALAHIEPQPKDWYMPVKADPQRGVQTALQLRRVTLQPGETWSSLRVLISLHMGDFFAPLALYREILTVQGLRPAEPNAEDYEPAWCSWGYEFDVRPSEMTGVLSKTNELGIRWLTLDDRWFDHYSDWNPRSDTFPGGEAQMRRMVDEIHRAGAYAQVWWYPLAVEDGVGHWDGYIYRVSEILRQHPDGLIRNEDGSVARNNRGLAILCPALPQVQEHIREMTLRFIRDWGFDGHKLDNIYTVPACHNPAHHHQRPEESTGALAEVYRIIFETTRSLKPYSVTQICPCGTLPTFTLLPYMDQAVTADPTSSAQIRQRIKFYKALLGSRSAVLADHVELSDEGVDFASEIGVGGVPATKFVWPDDPAVRARLKEWWGLPPEKQALLKTWLAIYRAHPLSEGEYLNWYDLAFDRPETHVIRKDNNLYYAFFAGRLDQVYHGPVTLRGLEPMTYRLHDYVRDVWLETVQGPKAVLDVQFEGSLLVEAIPQT